MEADIPDAAKSFAKRLDSIVENLDKGEYRLCYHAAIDLTRFSWMLNHADWVFLCEVLESVYGNMADLVDRLAVSGDAESGMRSKLRADMRDVIESHDGGDLASKYLALRKLRADTTAFQLDAFARYQRRT